MLLALYGKYCAGKSSFAKCLQRYWPELQVIETDVLARRYLLPDSPIVAEIQQRFGTADRLQLRALVFRDAAARAALESMIHPRVCQDLEDLTRDLWQDYLVELPLLRLPLFSRLAFDSLIVLHSAVVLQEARGLERDAASPVLVEAILAAQQEAASPELEQLLLQLPRYVVHNTGSWSDLERQAERLAHDLLLTKLTRI
jgi:dephospho-CoA kinase